MLALFINRNDNIPLIRQIYEQIRLRILHGELCQGERLPSTRDLAESLSVSRNVVLEAYDQLIAEGYMTSRQGSGTYVAEGAYWHTSYLDQSLDLNRNQATEMKYDKSLIDFRFGVPALDLFPKKKWSQMYQNVCADSPSSAFGYGAPEGCLELRQVLSHYLVKTRGVYCEPEQVIITTGAIQAIYLVANQMLSARDKLVTEDPLNINIRRIFLNTGADVLSIAVDEQGIRADLVPININLKLIYTTPSHQFPLGSTLSVQRRIELLKIARQTGCYILEDNYDNEFRFEGTPVSTLQGLDPERVIYTGTFSKILSPALRIGYLIVPPKLISEFRRLKNLLDHHSPTLNQLALARFIEQGYFERHIAKMKKVYKRRQEAILKGCGSYFPERVKVTGNSTGLHLIVEFNDVIFTDEVLGKLKKAGVNVYPVEMYAVNKGCYNNKIMLGYGNVNEEEIIEGIKRIKSVL
ncbi:MAG: PLP-dependent aminotransferase family protein [Syntrophomonas sp.]